MELWGSEKPGKEKKPHGDAHDAQDGHDFPQEGPHLISYSLRNARLLHHGFPSATMMKKMT
jgi:hypothetical protein